MSDVTLDEVDARARAAGVAERRAASLRPRPDVPTRRGVRWMRPALAFGVLAALVGGLVFIANRDTQEPADELPRLPDTRYLLTDLPDGYEPAAVSGPAPASAGVSARTLQWFAPEELTSGVVVAMDADPSHDQEWLDGQLSEYVEDSREIRIGDRRAVIATSNEFGDPEPRLLYVEVEEDRWVALITRGLTDDEVTAVGAALVVDPLAVRIDSGALPSGLQSVGAGPISALRAVLPVPGNPQMAAGTSAVLYSSADQSTYLTLVTAPEPRLSAAQATLFGGVPSAGPGPEGSLLFRGVMVSQLLWQADGVTFALTAGGALAPEQLGAVATSARLATEDEWVALRAEAETNWQAMQEPVVSSQVFGEFDASVVGSVLATGALQDGRPWSLQLAASSDDEYLAQLWIDGAEYGSWGPLGNSGFGVVVTPMGEHQVVFAVWPATDQPPSLTVSQPGLDDVVLELNPSVIEPSYATAAVVVSGDGPATGVLSDETGELARS